MSNAMSRSEDKRQHVVTRVEDMLKAYANIFEGIGKAKDVKVACT